MSYSARTVFYFGIYLSVTGLLLVATPNFVLELLGMARTDEVWIRVVGMLAGALGSYYILAARHELTVFIRMSVQLRSTVILLLGLFVWLGFAEMPILIFGAVDFLGAMWTWMALRTEGRS
ncbi:MAG: hypothetical protein ACKVU2_09955 [Saprospiraceae bacterium]